MLFFSIKKFGCWTATPRPLSKAQSRQGKASHMMHPSAQGWSAKGWSWIQLEAKSTLENMERQNLQGGTPALDSLLYASKEA